MSDISDTLMARAELIGLAVKSVSDNKLWRWDNFNKKDGLRVAGYRDGGTNLDYRRNSDRTAALLLGNIRPKDKLIDRKDEIIPVGSVKNVDGVTIECFNYNGIAPLPITYEGNFGKSRSFAEAAAYGFTQSIELSFKFQQGGEASFYKFEQELTLGFESRQDFSTTETNETTEQRSAGINPECPPAYDINFWMSRTSQPMKVRTTGKGDVEHSIEIGKHWDGKWHGHDGYKRHAEWDTFEAFLKVIKGDGARDQDLWEHFRKNPAPKWIVKALEKPLDIDFDHTSAEFDGWTTLQPHQEVVRGPNPEILKLL